MWIALGVVIAMDFNRPASMWDLAPYDIIDVTVMLTLFIYNNISKICNPNGQKSQREVLKAVVVVLKYFLTREKSLKFLRLKNDKCTLIYLYNRLLFWNKKNQL